MSFDFLYQFVPKKYPHLYKRTGESETGNIFGPVSERQILEAEQLQGFCFPKELRTFYLEVGDGYLRAPLSPEENFVSYNSNEILPPLVTAHFYKGIESYHEEPFEDPLYYDDHWLSNEALDMLEAGDLPFFEVYDSSCFITMKPHSDNPNAVWHRGRRKIEDSFETFIRRLYFEDPSYYSKNW
jgi:hypothetical protein